MNEPLFQHGICKQLAQKYNISEEEVKDIVYHQFKFINKTMTKGEFKSVRLPYWGKFDVHPTRLKKIKERSHDKRQ